MEWAQKYLEGERPPRVDAAAERLGDEQSRKEIVVSLVELFERHRAEMDRAVGALAAARASARSGEVARAKAQLQTKLQRSRALCAGLERALAEAPTRPSGRVVTQ